MGAGPWREGTRSIVAALCASPQIAYARHMPVTTLFATRIYSKSLIRGRTDNLNTRLLRECRQLSQEDGAGIQWSATNYPGGYTSYNSLARMHTMSPTFAALEKRIDAHVRMSETSCACAPANCRRCIRRDS